MAISGFIPTQFRSLSQGLYPRKVASARNRPAVWGWTVDCGVSRSERAKSERGFRLSFKGAVPLIAGFECSGDGDGLEHEGGNVGWLQVMIILNDEIEELPFLSG